jgi:hypothetical protein
VIILTVAFVCLLSFDQLTSIDSLNGRWIIVILYLAIAILNCSLYRKVVEIKQAEKYQRYAVKIPMVLLCVVALNFSSAISSVIRDIEIGYLDTVKRDILIHCLPSGVTLVALLAIVVQLICKIKKNYIVVILSCIAAVACVAEEGLKIYYQMIPYLSEHIEHGGIIGLIWSPLRYVVDALLLVEFATLVAPNKKRTT